MKRKCMLWMCLFIITALVLGACSPQATETPAAEVTSEQAEPVQETSAEEEVSEESAVEEPVAEPEADSKVGGTFVIAVSLEPDTLDPHKTHSATSDQVMSFLGTSLVALDPNGEIIPYVAKSWTASEDGLVWEFSLRDDVKFHDGTPLTAQDFVWTYQRAVSPETASPAAASMLGELTSVEALDDYTLRMTLANAYFPFLLTLASSGYLQPLPGAALEEMGEEVFARNPIGTGPYKLKEWLTGERVVLERNPDYSWAPAIGENPGAFYIENIEFRVIPEYATQIAGLEAGEIDYLVVETKDIDLFTNNSEYQIYEHPLQGIAPYLVLNLEAAPFNDVNVRKAFNLALDRQVMVDVLTNGNGVIQYGPISESVIGYWPGVEEIGYGYDVDQAATYMEQAGFVRNADGMWEKEGEVLSIPLAMVSGDESTTRVAQLVQEQYKRFGIEVELSVVDSGIYRDTVLGGDFSACFANWYYSEADLLYLIFHSSMIGALNVHRLNDPEIDALLERTRTETDPQARQEAVNEAQQWLVENAVVVPLYAATENYVMRAKLKGLIYSNQFGFYYNDAYIEE